MDDETTGGPEKSRVCFEESEQWARCRIQSWIQGLLEEEATEFLGRSHYERWGIETEGYRNG